MTSRHVCSEGQPGTPSARDSGQGRRPRGETSAKQGEARASAPRMPHERDESADQQGAHEPSMQLMGRLAQADVERGAADTSRAAEVDATYHRLREDTPQPGGPSRPRRPLRP